MSREDRAIIRDRLNLVANMLAGVSAAEQPGPAEASAIVDLAERLFFDINRGADALERIAYAQEARLEIEKTKAGMFKNAIDPPKPSPIIRPQGG